MFKECYQAYNKKSYSLYIESVILLKNEVFIYCISQSCQHLEKGTYLLVVRLIRCGNNKMELTM